MVEVIKLSVVNFELLLNVNLIVGTILDKRPRPQLQQNFTLSGLTPLVSLESV